MSLNDRNHSYFVSSSMFESVSFKETYVCACEKDYVNVYAHYCVYVCVCMCAIECFYIRISSCVYLDNFSYIDIVEYACVKTYYLGNCVHVSMKC